MTAHWKRGWRLPLRTSVLTVTVRTNIAASTRTTAVVSQRPGWRTGIAFTPATCASSPPLLGRLCAGPVSAGGMGGSAVTGGGRGRLARGPVDHRVGDGPGLEVPFAHDVPVGAVGHQVLHGGEDRFGHPALRQGDAIGGGGERLAGELELPVGLLDNVGR